MKKKEMAKRIRRLEKSMELTVSLLSVLMDHIDMKRHARILTREEMLARGGIDTILERQVREVHEIEKLAEQERIDYRQAVFRYYYQKRQNECRKNVKELEDIWMGESSRMDSR